MEPFLRSGLSSDSIPVSSSESEELLPLPQNRRCTAHPSVFTDAAAVPSTREASGKEEELQNRLVSLPAPRATRERHRTRRRRCSTSGVGMNVNSSASLMSSSGPAMAAPREMYGSSAQALEEEQRAASMDHVWPVGVTTVEERILRVIDAESDNNGGSRQSGHKSHSSTPGRRHSTDALLDPQDNAASVAGAGAMPEDPRNRILGLILDSPFFGLAMSEIERLMEWAAVYKVTYGSLEEYLHSYQSIFVISPLDDEVRLRRNFTKQLITDAHRSKAGGSVSNSYPRRRMSSSRTLKTSMPNAETLAAHIGSVSYSCVADEFDLDVLETVYRRRGYQVRLLYEVLHVFCADKFDLFAFPSGVVVWWGMNRQHHWMVEDDFLNPSTYLADAMQRRYTQTAIESLFPIWCSFETDEQYGALGSSTSLGMRSTSVEAALERFAKVLCFDHYLIPSREPERGLVMLTFSHSLGRSARVDYFEFVTQSSHRHVLSISDQLRGLLDYFSTKRQISKMEGELQVAQLAIQTIKDTPEVLWEMPWLNAYYEMTDEQNCANQRLTFFVSRSDALLQQLSHIKARRHRLFMLGSDVFLIVLLILDVLFMTSRLVVKMYFKVEE